MRFLVPLALAIAAVAAFLLLRAPATTVHVVEARALLAFPGATGWTEQPSCTEVQSGEACAGEWTHVGGQRARVLLVPVVDATRLAQLTARLRAGVEEKGGVVGEFDAVVGGAATKVVRLLQPAVRAEDSHALVNITYLVPEPGGRVLHLLTSLVVEEDQVAADARVRDLLQFAVWQDGTAEP